MGHCSCTVVKPRCFGLGILAEPIAFAGVLAAPDFLPRLSVAGCRTISEVLLGNEDFAHRANKHRGGPFQDRKLALESGEPPR